MDGLPFAQCGTLEFERPQLAPAQHTLITGFPDFLDDRNSTRLRLLLRKLISTLKMQRFAVSPEFYETLLKYFSEALSSSEFQKFRVDPLAVDSPVIFSGEPLAVFHIGRFNNASRQLRTGSEVIDIVCTGVPVLDQSGRYIGEAEGWPHLENVENWIERRRNHVH
jgi:hypothetical protein